VDQEEGSSFCEQKEAKKLFDHWFRCCGNTETNEMKFFAHFFAKRRRLLALTSAGLEMP
jgi:hypothetical protein